MENQTINNGPLSTPPNNNMVYAILTTLFCCLPAGIYAIIKSTEVNSKWNAGDQAGAIAAAEEAKKWSMYGAIGGVVVYVLYFLFFGGMAMLGA